MFKKGDGVVSSEVKTKGRKSRVAMVPLLSLRSMIGLTIGVVVGAGLGLGYWMLSPSLVPQAPAGAEVGQQSALVEFVPSSHTGPWTSEVSIEMVNPGVTYMPITALYSKGQYYASKVNSLPFLRFLSQELFKQAPQYQHSSDELSVMIAASLARNSTKLLNSISEVPAITIKATAFSAEETLFLGNFVPEVFQSYLVAEEKDMERQARQNTLAEIESTKAALFEAEKELNSLAVQETADISNDPTQIALNSIVEALKREVQRKATDVAAMIAKGDGDEESEIQAQYEKTLRESESARAAIAKAEQELNALSLRKAANDVRNNPAYATLNAKIMALELELNRQAANMAVWIAAGDTGDSYTNALTGVERTSTALTEARKALAALEAQAVTGQAAKDLLEYEAAKRKVDNLNKDLTALKDKLNSLQTRSTRSQAYADTQVELERVSDALAKVNNEIAVAKRQARVANLAENLAYQIARGKVDRLNRDLGRLNDRLSPAFAQDAGAAAITELLAVGSPSLPMPVLPERMRVRNVLMMGAVLGMGVVWVGLNSRWLIKSLSSSPEEEEDVA